jgi:hypothetical protein
MESVTTLAGVPIPDPARSVVAVAAPEAGAGHWAGAPSAALVDGAFWLAYRLRRPVGDGRGYAVVVARSADGVEFEPVGRVERDAFGAASLERPALVPRPSGGWRLYVSCATPGSQHWWVDALDADDPAGFDPGRRVTVLPGDAATAVKDPLVHAGSDGWRAWVCCHPLAVPGDADRMVSRLATSPDGLAWAWGPEVLAGTPGTWDQRGARITSVVAGLDGPVAFYDGRAGADENWEERTGVAVAGPGGVFAALPGGPAAVSPHGSASLRYMSVVALPGGGHRLYYEAARPDGGHDLRTEMVPPPPLGAGG